MAEEKQFSADTVADEHRKMVISITFMRIVTPEIRSCLFQIHPYFTRIYFANWKLQTEKRPHQYVSSHDILVSKVGARCF